MDGGKMSMRTLTRRIRPASATLDATVEDAASWLANQQRDDGHWVFELEADATIPSEYVFLNHFLDEIDEAIEQGIGNYLRRIQSEEGGWPLFFEGDSDLSATVKAYFALKLIGDDPDAPHMRKARAFILKMGGAARANVFTRYMLALFGQVPWRALPLIRPEAVLLPKRAPFHLDKVSYWSRTTMVPMFVVVALKPRAKNPRGVGVSELFTVPPEKEKHYLVNPTGHWLGQVFLAADHVGRLAKPLYAPALQRTAIERAMQFVHERINGEDGLGAIYPAMANALIAMDALGYPKEHSDRLAARRAINRLLVVRENEAYLQPCVSPIWDTALALHACLETGGDIGTAAGGASPLVANACQWLRDRQVLDVKGDWATNRPDLRSGGWAFQYRNDHYPDVDDTAVVVMALHRSDPVANAKAIARGAEWVIGMQSRNGGWGAFDADNEHYVLNHIPFADHGALLDPPTSDVTARCLGMLAQLGHGTDDPVVARGVDFLRQEQEADGSWFGRWGTNYIYGTWSVLCALNAVGEDMNSPYIRKAVAWLKGRQRVDGGWGEDCASYDPNRRLEVKASTPSQTAWAMLALMAAGDVESEAVADGVQYLLESPRDGGQWREDYYNAVGFPRVFYLRYYGYSAYFPLWALSRYRNLKQSNSKRPSYGI
ncbi:MAG: squalene--hopene cyclase [Rhodospirillales bacterium]|nr:squalene--hopene cyclase [Rhodospirillales bacterium]